MKILHIVGARPNFMKAAPITSTALRQAQDKAQYKHAADGEVPAGVRATPGAHRPALRRQHVEGVLRGFGEESRLGKKCANGLTCNAPILSVIIPTKNRQADLLETVEAVLAQTRLPDELVVVDQSVDDGIGTRLKWRLDNEPWPKLIYIWDPIITGVSMARNVGFAVSNGNLICYLDDDVTPAPDYLAEITHGFAAFPEWDGLCGRFMQADHRPVWRRWGSTLFRRGLFQDDLTCLATLDAPRPMRQLTTAACCLRREVLEHFRFDENLEGYALGEDVDFCLRAGRVFCFGAIPAAQVYHRHSPVNRPGRLRTQRAAQTSATYLWRRHRRHPGDDLCYLWLCLGLGLEVLLLSARVLGRRAIGERGS